MRPVSRFDQLRHHPDAVAGFPDAAFEHFRYAQRLGNAADVLVFALERECGRAGDDLEPWNASQRVDDFLGQPIAEVLVLLVAAHVLERQHDDRGLFDGLARGQLIERGAQLAHRLEAVGRPFRQASPDEPFDHEWCVERRRIVAQQRAQHLRVGVARECPSARQQLVKHRAEAEDVRPRIERLALGLLGRHVRRGTDVRARDGARRVIGVAGRRSISLAIPKSSSLAVGGSDEPPPRVTSTFAGFRSRWRMPR